MGISGNLKTMDLAEILQWLSQGQKTGTLVIDGPKVAKRIFFRDGVIISSASSDPKEYLGHFLCSHGYISEEEVNAAIARQKQEKKLLGQILVGMELVTEAQLQELLQLKAEEAIYDIFTWDEAEFEFLDDELPEETMVQMRLDVQWIVLEGSRRKDEWLRIREWVPSPLAVPVLIYDISEVEMEEVDRRILEWVDDDRTVEEISEGAQTNLFLIAQTIAQYVEQGILKVVRPRIIEVTKPAKKGDGQASAAENAPQVIPPSSHPQMMPPGQMPPGQMPPGQMPPGQMPPGQMPPGQMSQGYPGMQPAYPYGMPDGQSPQHPSPQAPPGVAVGGRTLHFAGGGAGGGAPEESSTTEAERLLEKAESHLKRGDLDEALERYRESRVAEGSGPSVKSAAEEGERKVSEALERAGISLAAVPELKCSEGKLAELDISPHEGYFLTRLDGSNDIQSILKILPMPLQKIDTQVLLWKLRKSGYVSV